MKEHCIFRHTIWGFFFLLSQPFNKALLFMHNKWERFQAVQFSVLDIAFIWAVKVKYCLVVCDLLELITQSRKIVWQVPRASPWELHGLLLSYLQSNFSLTNSYRFMCSTRELRYWSLRGKTLLLIRNLLPCIREENWKVELASYNLFWGFSQQWNNCIPLFIIF